MSEKKVEKYKLTADQMLFAKDYRRLLKVQRGLLARLQQKMSEASQARTQLQELEALMGQRVSQAPAPIVKELAGQEESVR